jgi:hypothetical protein
MRHLLPVVRAAQPMILVAASADDALIVLDPGWRAGVPVFNNLTTASAILRI